MDKQIIVHLYNDDHSATKKEQATNTFNNMDESQSIPIMLGERSQTHKTTNHII